MQRFLFVLGAMLAACVLFQETNGASISYRDQRRVSSRLQRILGPIPDKVNKIIAMLDKHMHLLQCLPTKKVSSGCYESPNFCSHPSFKLPKKISFKLKFGICTGPWKITIRVKLFSRSLWSLVVSPSFGPMVIHIKTNNNEGVTKINSLASGKVRALGFLNVLKGELKIDGIIRWDCTRPKYNNLKRWRYNTGYNDGKPGLDYNKLYYKLHVRMEVKKKRFPCFCYRCYKDYCKDLVKKQGHFGSGPRSCIRDTLGYFAYMERIRIEKRKRCMRMGRCGHIP